jgi:hypothetical protein
MLDAYSTLHDDAELRMLQQACDLYDLQAQAPSLSTYLGAANRRIVYMFGCGRVLDSVR